MTISGLKFGWGRPSSTIQPDFTIPADIQGSSVAVDPTPAAETRRDSKKASTQDADLREFYQRQAAEAERERKELPRILQVLYPLKGQRVGKAAKVGQGQLKDAYWQLALDNPALAQKLSKQMASREAVLLDLVQGMFINSGTQVQTLGEIHDPVLLERLLTRHVRSHESAFSAVLPYIDQLPSDEAKIRVLSEAFRQASRYSRGPLFQQLASISDPARRDMFLAKQVDFISSRKPKIRQFYLDHIEDDATRAKLAAAFDEIEANRASRYDADCVRSVQRQYPEDGIIGEAIKGYLHYTSLSEYVIRDALPILGHVTDPDLKDRILQMALQNESCRYEASKNLRHFSNDAALDKAIRSYLGEDASSLDYGHQTVASQAQYFRDSGYLERFLSKYPIGTKKLGDIPETLYYGQLKKQALAIADADERYEFLLRHAPSGEGKPRYSPTISDKVGTSLIPVFASIQNPEHLEDLLNRYRWHEQRTLQAVLKASSPEESVRDLLKSAGRHSIMGISNEAIVELFPLLKSDQAKAILIQGLSQIQYDSSRLIDEDRSLLIPQFLTEIQDRKVLSELLPELSQSDNINVLLGVMDAAQKSGCSIDWNDVVPRAGRAIKAFRYDGRAQADAAAKAVAPYLDKVSDSARDAVMSDILKSFVDAEVKLQCLEPLIQDGSASGFIHKVFPGYEFHDQRSDLTRMAEAKISARKANGLLGDMAYTRLLQDWLKQNDLKVAPELALFALGRLKVYGRDGGELGGVLADYTRLQDIAVRDAAKFAPNGTKPLRPIDMKAFLDKNAGKIMDAMIMLGPAPVIEMFYQKQEKFERFLTTVQYFQTRKDPQMLRALHDFCHLPDASKRSYPLEKAHFLEIAKAFCELSYYSQLKEQLASSISNPKARFDLAALKRSLLGAVLGKVLTQDELNDIHDLKFNQWDWKFIHTLPIALNSFSQDKKERLQALVKAGVQDGYWRHIFSGDLGQVNADTRRSFAKNGLSYNTWLKYSETVEFNANPASAENQLATLRNRIQGDVDTLLAVPNLGAALATALSGTGCRVEENLLVLPDNFGKAQAQTLIAKVNEFLREHPSDLPQVNTIDDHFTQYQRDAQAISETKEQAQDRRLTMSVWSRPNLQKNLFIGSRSGACTALDGINAPGTLDALEHTMIQVLDIREMPSADDAKEETVGKVLLYWAKNPDTKQLYLVANTFEMQHAFEQNPVIRDQVTEYMKKYAWAVSGGQKVILLTGINYNDVPLADLGNPEPVDLNVIGQATNGQYYLDSLTKGQWTQLHQTYRPSMYKLGETEAA